MVWSIVTVALLAASPEFQLGLADGMQVRGSLEAATADVLIVQTGTGRREIPASQLLTIAPAAASEYFVDAATVWIDLIDGTQLWAVGYTVTDGNATISFGGDLSITLPISAIRSVRLKEQPEAIAKQWEAVLKQTPKADLIVIREENAIDYLEGLFGAVTSETVEFELDGDKIPVKRPKVEGLIYYHAKQTALPPGVCTVTDRAGSRIQVASMTLADGTLRLTTPAGAVLPLPLERVSAMAFPARYLSDFKPEHILFETRLREPRGVAARIAQRYQPRFDRALEAGPMRLAGREYAKGVALHSRSEVTWLLTEPFVKFSAVAGIDDRVRPQGNVRLTIRGDDRVLLEQNVQGSDAPLPISLDLTGVTRLKITVDFGDDGIETGDYLDLCDPRLYK